MTPGEIAFVFVVLALSAGAMLAAAPADATASQPLPTKVFQNLAAGKKQTIVTYGTSVTEYGPWVAMMRQWFDQQYPGLVTVINSGGSGQNSAWGVANLKQRVLDKKPDLVFIEFSINDAVLRFKLSVDDALKNLDTMVKAIRAQNPDAQIVLQTMNNTWDTPDGGSAGKDRPRLDEYEQGYRRYAHENGLPLVDHYPAWARIQKEDPAKYQSYIPDGRHPNREGILAVMWPTLKAFLEQSAK